MVPEDRISNLPEGLVHEIISCLPARSAARLTVLSKKWQHFYETLQCINFNLEEFQDGNGNILLWKIDQFMSKYLSIQSPYAFHKVKFSSHCIFHAKVGAHITECVELARRGRIQELDLLFWHSHMDYCVCLLLPNNFFHSQLHLTVLKLEGCRVWGNQFAGFPFLKALSLAHSHISHKTLSNMVHACPIIVSLTLKSCYQLRKVCLTSPSLQRLDVRHCLLVKSFYMDLPLLHTFEYDASPLHMDKDRHGSFPVTEFVTPKDMVFQSMGDLYLSYVTLENATLQQIFAIFPNLNDIRMKQCRLSHGSLDVYRNFKKFSMVDVSYLVLLERFASSLEVLHCENNAHCWAVTNYIRSCNVTFVRLTSLTLGGFFTLSDEDLETLLSNCPLLENLNLENCLSLKTLKISSQSLKTLIVEIQHQQEEEGTKITNAEIEAPNLVSFDYDGLDIVFTHVNVSHELICLLRFGERVGYSTNHQTFELRDSFGRFKEVTKLIITIGPIEFFFAPEEGSSDLVHPEFSWGHVKVKVHKSCISYDEVLYMVCISSCCTRLSIELESSSVEFKFLDLMQLDTLNLHLGSHDCIRDHLVEVTFQSIEGNVHEMNLLDYILRKAEHLKSLVITMKSRQSAASQKTCGFSPMLQHIKKIPYISRKCQFVILS